MGAPPARFFGNVKIFWKRQERLHATTTARTLRPSPDSMPTVHTQVKCALHSHDRPYLIRIKVSKHPISSAISGAGRTPRPALIITLKAFP